jgi:nucleolar protein 58
VSRYALISGDPSLGIYLTGNAIQEWYGWHFPEMGKIIVDNLAYAKVVREMGMFLH